MLFESFQKCIRNMKLGKQKKTKNKTKTRTENKAEKKWQN